jgi:hypothetical protein
MSAAASGRPGRDEAAPYYFRYIDRVEEPDVVAHLERQASDTLAFLCGISEEASTRRYRPEKWSVRQIWSHVNDTERIFVCRALWFARGFDSPLPSYDQEICVAGAGADEVPLADHVEEFRGVRAATLSFFRNLPAAAWGRRGVASDNPFTVRALAYVVAGHVAHHRQVIEEKYLASP